MRLIDADALVKCFTDWVTETNSVERYNVADVVRIIENAPTVDAVPVVRCAECRHMDDSFHTNGFDGMCRYWKSHSTDYSWFCSNGERRSE